MSARRGYDFRIVVAGVTIVAFMATVLFAVLIVIAHPPGLQTRLSGATRQIDRLEAELQSPGQPYVYSAHALCRGRPEVEAAALKQHLTADAGARGVTLSNLSATLGVADETAGGIAPVALQFEADGRYDSVVGFMDALAKSQPEVFVDAVDLKSQTSSVALKFTGRIYCSLSVPL